MSAAMASGYGILDERGVRSPPYPSMKFLGMRGGVRRLTMLTFYFFGWQPHGLCRTSISSKGMPRKQMTVDYG